MKRIAASLVLLCLAAQFGCGGNAPPKPVQITYNWPNPAIAPQILVQGNAMRFEEVPRELRRLSAESKKKGDPLRVQISADAALPYRWISPAIISCAQADITNVEFELSGATSPFDMYFVDKSDIGRKEYKIIKLTTSAGVTTATIDRSEPVKLADLETEVAKIDKATNPGFVISPNSTTPFGDVFSTLVKLKKQNLPVFPAPPDD